MADQFTATFHQEHPNDFPQNFDLLNMTIWKLIGLELYFVGETDLSEELQVEEQLVEKSRKAIEQLPDEEFEEGDNLESDQSISD